VSVDSSFWSELIELNKHVDGLIDRCLRAIEPTQPIGREIPFFGSIEARFDNLPMLYSDVPAPNSDILAGNNIKRPVFTNGGSRVYVREISFQTFRARKQFENVDNDALSRQTDYVRFPINFRWNFETSITQRKYCDKRVLANAGGRSLAGNHMAFREPLVIEPRETFIFECELLSYGMSQAPDSEDENRDKAIIAMYLSGYREGV
jgi:hypothetical protein